MNWKKLGRYGLSLGLVGAALALTLLIRQIHSDGGYLAFYGAVVAASWFGGKWPGWLSVILSMAAVEYFFVPPFYSFGLRRESVPLFIEFATSSAVIGWFSSWRKEAELELKRARSELQRRVEERTAELEHSNEQLLAEMAERQRAEEAYREAMRTVAGYGPTQTGILARPFNSRCQSTNRLRHETFHSNCVHRKLRCVQRDEL